MTAPGETYVAALLVMLGFILMAGVAVGCASADRGWKQQ